MYLVSFYFIVLLEYKLTEDGDCILSYWCDEKIDLLA